MDLGSLFLILIPLILGAFLYFLQPFRHNRLSPTYDFVGVIVMACLFLVGLGLTIVGPTVDQERNTEICNADRIEKLCYRIPEAVCINMWEKYEAACEEEVRTELGERVTALIGPAVRKCTYRKFDKSLYYTRKNSDLPECQAHFEAMK